MTQLVKNLPAIQETQEVQGQSLGQKDPLEKEMAVHSSILTWKIPWAEEPGRLQSKGSQGVGCNWARTAKNYPTVLEIFHLLTPTLLLGYKSTLAPAVLGMEPSSILSSLSPITTFPE